MAYMFRYDTIHGRFKGKVEGKDNKLIIDTHDGKHYEIICTECRDPKDIPWCDYDVDWVIESSGAFTTLEKCMGHIKGQFFI